MKKAALWAQRLFTHTPASPTDSSSTSSSATSPQPISSGGKQSSKPRSVFGYHLKGNSSATSLTNPPASSPSSSLWPFNRSSRASSSTAYLPALQDSKGPKSRGKKDRHQQQTCPAQSINQCTPLGGHPTIYKNDNGQENIVSSHSSALPSSKSSIISYTPGTKAHLSKRFSILHSPFGPRGHAGEDARSTSGLAWMDTTEKLLPPGPITDDSTSPSSRRNSQRYSIESFKRFGVSLTGGVSRSRKNSQPNMPSSVIRTAAAAASSSLSRINLLASNNKSTPSLLGTNALPPSSTTKGSSSNSSQSSRLISAPIYLEPAPIMTPLRPPPAPPMSQPLPPLSPALMSSALLPDLPKSTEMMDIHHDSNNHLSSTRPLEIKKPHTTTTTSTHVDPFNHQPSNDSDDNDKTSEPINSHVMMTTIDCMPTPWANDKALQALQLVQELTDRVDDLSKVIHSSRATAAALSKKTSCGIKQARRHARPLPDPPKDPIPPPPPNSMYCYATTSVAQSTLISPLPSAPSSSTSCCSSSSHFCSPATTPTMFSSCSSSQPTNPLKDSIVSTSDSSSDMFVTAAIQPLDPEGEETEERIHAASTATTTAATKNNPIAAATARSSMLADLMLEVQREIKSCRSSITSLMSPLMIRLNQDPSSSSTAASSFVSAAASLATYPGIDAKSGGPSVTDSTSTTNPIAPTVMNVKPSSHRRGRTQSRQASFVNSLPSLEDFGVFQNELTSATLADLAASEPLHSSPLPMTTGGSPSTTLAMPTPVPSLSLSSSQQKAKKPQPQSDEAFSDSLTSCIITGLLPTLSEGHDEKQLTKSPSVQVASPSAMQSFTPMHHPSLSPLPPPRAISSSLMPSTSSCISSPTNANDCHPLAVMQMMSQSLQQLEKRVALYEKEWPQLVGMLLFHDERLTRLEMGMVDDGDDEIDVAAGPLSDDPLALDALQQGPEAALSPFSAQLALWEKRDRKRKAKDRRAKAGSLPDNKRQQQQQPPQQLLPSSPLLFEPVTHADSVSSLHSACSSASDGSSAAAVAGWSATIDEDDYEEGDDEEEEYNDEEEYDDEEEEEEDGQDDRSLLPPSSSIGSITAKRGSWAYCDEATVQSLARDIRALHARVEAQDGEWHRKYCDLHEEVLQHMFGHLSDHDARYP